MAASNKQKQKDEDITEENLTVWSEFNETLKWARFPGPGVQPLQSRGFGIAHSCVTWASYLIPLSIRFLLCKQLIILVPTSQDCCMDFSVYKVFNSLWQLNEYLVPSNYCCDSLVLCWERKWWWGYCSCSVEDAEGKDWVCGEELAGCWVSRIWVTGRRRQGRTRLTLDCSCRQWKGSDTLSHLAI